MYSAEQLFNDLSYEELYDTLKSIVEEDVYLSDYLECDLASDFIYLLEIYDIIWIASDDRLLLTQKGEKIYQFISFTVDLSKKSRKVKTRKL
jgi:hypothetical protein